MAYATTTRHRARFAPNIEPNVIPFIDVLLVLLIIFMVTAPRPTTDLRVDRPNRHPGPASLIEPTIVQIRASPDGAAIFVSGRQTTLASVADRTFAHILAANPTLAPQEVHAQARVYVRSDLDVAYHNVIDVVDALKTRDFERVSIVAPEADAG